MKITERQLQMMYQVLIDSLSILDRSGLSLFKINQETRTKLAQEIINQQSDEIKDIGE